MPLSALETIATIFIVIALIKIIVITFNKKVWYNGVAKPIYKNSQVSTLVFVALALIMFYYVLKELTLIQLIAVMALTSSLMALGFLQYSGDITQFLSKTYNKKIGSWQWFYIIFWVILLVLTLYEIF